MLAAAGTDWPGIILALGAFMAAMGTLLAQIASRKDIREAKAEAKAGREEAQAAGAVALNVEKTAKAIETKVDGRLTEFIKLNDELRAMVVRLTGAPPESAKTEAAAVKAEDKRGVDAVTAPVPPPTTSSGEAP